MPIYRNFQERVSLICSLETNGKISQKEAYKQVEALWEELKRSRELLFMIE